MAAEIIKLCEEYEVSYNLLRDTSPGSVTVSLEDERTSLSTRVKFEADSIQPNIFVLSWCFSGFSLESPWQINPAVFPDHNNVHFRKATDIAYGWENLRSIITTRLKQIAAGEATRPKTP